MSQLITALPVGAEIKIPETFNGATNSAPYMIVSKGASNPYGSDKVFIIRKKSLSGYYRGNSTPYPQSTGYVDDLLDRTCVSMIERFDEVTKIAFSTSTVKCFDPTTNETFTIDRLFFAPSYNEMGGNKEIDPSEHLAYFDENSKRLAGCEDTTGNQPYCLRTFFGSELKTGYGTITSTGALSTGGSWNRNDYFRPACNIFATTLVSDEPDEDGYYALIPDPSDPYIYVRFDASLGSVAKTPLKIRVDLTTEGNPEITSLQVCNNYGDTNPTWETMTLGEAHTFTNTTKETANWEIGVTVVARGENTIRVYEPFAIIQTEVD